MTSAESFPRPFGRYTLLGNLAQGGMGALYLACQGEKGLEKLCVVKTVLPHLADKEYVARFRDEAKVVVRLSHGNLVPVFDAGVVKSGGTDELYLAMEHVDGKDLRAVWNRCAKKGIAFPVDVAVYIARELARGLSHAHSFGAMRLVHRDVSPPNILLSFSGEVKLTDFGLAASILKTEKTSPGIVYGKVSYMSPEQARGESLDGRTDLYAVGIILWELLTGKQLFPQSEPNLIDRVRAPEIEKPSVYAPRVVPALDEIVMRALSPDLASRYADCEQLRTALATFLAETSPTLDNDRIAKFLQQLFGEEIEAERAVRRGMIEALHRERSDTQVMAPSSDMPAAVSGLIGTMLDGRYLVKKRIGEGGMGAVFEAEHVDIGRRVAVKVLHSVYSRTPEVVARFRSEARAATRIGHPHIIDVFDSGTTVDGQVYIVMEFLEGHDLADIVHKEGALPQKRAIAIAREICQALSAAHKAGIVHRDMKPENVFLVERDGRADFVKVLDFGIAKTLEGVSERVGRLTEPGLAMGTPEYMAPEQAAGGAVDARADIYAVGAILYEMLTGRPPHEGSNVMEVLTRKATQPPAAIAQRRPDVSHELDRLVMRALASKPEDRPQSADVFAQELGRLVEGTTAQTRISMPRVRQEADHRSLYWAGGILGALALLAVAAPIFFAPSPKPSLQPTPDPQPSPQPKPQLKPQPEPQPQPTPPPTTAPAPEAFEPIPIKRTRPDSVKLTEARQAAEAGQLLLARQLYRKLANSPADRAAAHVGLSEIAFKRAEFEEAAAEARSAITAGAGLPAKMALGNAELRLKHYDRAITAYRDVLKLKPNHREAAENLELAERLR